jgi:hypothetical protein
MRIIHSPQRHAAPELFAETRQRAPGGDTLPRLARAVQTRTGRIAGIAHNIAPNSV